MEWQPIETAPNDGTRVLVWLTRSPARSGRPQVVMGAPWHDGKQAWWIDCATHWMPLPEPPSIRGS
jgi:hypothetical protein